MTRKLTRQCHGWQGWVYVQLALHMPQCCAEEQVSRGDCRRVGVLQVQQSWTAHSLLNHILTRAPAVRPTDAPELSGTVSQEAGKS